MRCVWKQQLYIRQRPTVALSEIIFHCQLCTKMTTQNGWRTDFSEFWSELSQDSSESNNYIMARGMSHMWMSYVTHLNDSSHTREWVTSHVWRSHVTHEWVMFVIRASRRQEQDFYVAGQEILKGQISTQFTVKNEYRSDFWEIWSELAKDRSAFLMSLSHQILKSQRFTKFNMKTGIEVIIEKFDQS